MRVRTDVIVGGSPHPLFCDTCRFSGSRGLRLLWPLSSLGRLNFVSRHFGTEPRDSSVYCRAISFWNRALSPVFGGAPQAKLHTSILQANDLKRFGSANGNRTRI